VADALGNFGPQAEAAIPTLQNLLKENPDDLRITSAIENAIKKIKGESK
jgi:hypothetical protein